MLEGFSTVLCAFFVFCLYRQDLIKNRTYFYATFACLIAIIFCNVFYYFMGTATGQGLFAIMLGVFHVLALVLTMAYIGGVGLRQIGFEVIQAAGDARARGDAKQGVMSAPVKEPKSEAAPVERPVDRPLEPPPREGLEKPRIMIELPKKGEQPGSIPVE